MEIKDLQGKLVAVLGYGQEGKALAAYLLKHGLNPVLFDQRPWADWPADEQAKIKALGVNFIFGPDAFKELAGFDVAFRSPGIKLAELSTYSLQLSSQTKWFFEHCPAKIIGVTGTKGKGTTATLISRILKLQCQMSNFKCQTYLTGNIGATQPLEILDDLSPDDWVVYELSSFQLQDLETSPHIGVVLMVTQEHLDYHKDVDEYVEAKSAIVKYQTVNDFAIINADFENSMKIGKLGSGKKAYFSRKKEVGPGCYVRDGKVIGVSFEGQKMEILKTEELQLRGEHNLENVCAAILASYVSGVNAKYIPDAVKNFKGLEHRLEFVAEKNGIKFYNDSFSTTPETAVAAIKSFTEPLVVILGGSTKHSDFTELGKTVAAAKNIKALILIGDEAKTIEQSINKAGGTKARIFQGAASMPEIFDQIRPVAIKGDVVLLSPACASFGMFKNYKERGEQFKKSAEFF